MLRNSFLFLTSILIVVFSSCNSAVKKEQFAKIDSLIALLDSASKHLEIINMDTVNKKYQAYQETNNLVAVHYQKYRNDENWKYLCAFQNVRKPFKTMVKGYGSYKNDLASSKEQLENMKHDVDKNLLDEKEFKDYFDVEAKSAHELTFKINKQVEGVLRQYENFDTVHPYLLKLLATYPKDQPSEK